MKNISRLSDFIKEHSKKKNVCEAFSSFARKSFGSRKDIDELILLQDEYRKAHSWDNNFHCLIEAGGYLGSRFDETADYFFEKLISSEEDKTDYKYFLSHCLTIAAKINPHATELLWKLSSSAQISAFRAYGPRADNDIEKRFRMLEVEHLEINSDVTRGMADSRKLFDIASPEVIIFLIDKLVTSRFSPTRMEQLLAQALGDNPVVSCQILNADGSFSTISQDFSNQVLPLLRNSNLFNTISPIGDLFSKWCSKERGYKTDIIRTLADHESYIAFLIDFIKMKIKNLDSEIRSPSIGEAIKMIAENEGKEVDVDVEIERMKEDKASLEKCVLRLENKETREAEFEFQMRIANRIRKEHGKQPEVFEFIDWMKNEILNKTTRYII